MARQGASRRPAGTPFLRTNPETRSSIATLARHLPCCIAEPAAHHRLPAIRTFRPLRSFGPNPANPGDKDEPRRNEVPRHRIPVQGPLRQLHRRQVGAAALRPVLRQHLAGDRRSLLPDRALQRRRRGTGAGRRARRQDRLGPYLAGRARQCPQPHRRPHGGQPQAHCRGRDHRQRQAAARDHGGRPAARGRPLPLLRRHRARPEGGISEIDHDTIAYHFHEPLGVVGQIIPWNFRC